MLRARDLCESGCWRPILHIQGVQVYTFVSTGPISFEWHDRDRHLVICRIRSSAIMKRRIGERLLTSITLPGQVCVQVAEELCTWQINEPQESACFLLPKEVLRSPETTHAPHYSLRMSCFEPNATLFEKCVLLLDHADHGSESLFKLLGDCSHLARLAVQDKRRMISHSGSGQPRRLSPCILRAVAAMIDNSLAQQLSVAALAQLAGMTPHYFIHIFRESVGLTPYQYLTMQRILLAKHLLRTTEMNLAAISLETGFSSQSHFGHAFALRTGMTPRQYRDVHTQILVSRKTILEDLNRQSTFGSIHTRNTSHVRLDNSTFAA